MSEYTLTQELLKRSDASNWDEAKLEWEVIDVEEVDELETCLCGHFPIREVCTIKNTKTREEARVGNSCVKKFNNKSDKIFRAVAKVKKNLEKSVNSETLELSFKNSWISQSDYKFYIDILRQRKLSPKQLSWKMSINQKILGRMNKKKIAL